MTTENDMHRDDDIWNEPYNSSVQFTSTEFDDSQSNYTYVNFWNKTHVNSSDFLELAFFGFGCTEVDDGWRLADIVVQSILIPVTIVTNVLVIAAPIYWRKLRTPDNMLMVNLAIADLLTSTVSMPLSLVVVETELLGAIRRNDDGCVFFQMVQMLPTTLSILTLDLMNLERFLAIKFPLVHAQKVDTKWALYAIVFVWAYALALYGTGLHAFKFDVTNIFFQHSIESDKNNCHCVGDKTIPRWWIHLMWGNILGSIVCSWISVVYLIVVIKKQKVRADVKHNHVNMNVFLLLAYTLLWMPMAVLGSHVNVGIHTDIDKYKTYVLTWIPICVNASVNGLIYAYCRKRNKMAYKFLISNWPWRWGLLGIHCTTIEAQRFIRLTSAKTYNRSKVRHHRINLQVLGHASGSEIEIYDTSSVHGVVFLPSVTVSGMEYPGRKNKPKMVTFQGGTRTAETGLLSQRLKGSPVLLWARGLTSPMSLNSMLSPVVSDKSNATSRCSTPKECKTPRNATPCKGRSKEK